MLVWPAPQLPAIASSTGEIQAFNTLLQNLKQGCAPAQERGTLQAAHCNATLSMLAADASWCCARQKDLFFTALTMPCCRDFLFSAAWLQHTSI